MSRFQFIISGLFFFILLSGLAAFAQYENVWAFGTNAGLNFNSSNPLSTQTNISSGEASASVCNDGGQLLFYTDGNKVWDRNNNLMPNGAALISDFSYPDPNSPPTASTSQGALIVPMPDSIGKYYLFSLTSIEMLQNSGRLYSSVVNMNLNGGLGDVELGRKGILLDSMLSEQMTATLGEHCNVWIMVAKHDLTAWKFKAFELSGSGLNPVPVISIFPIPISGAANPGTMEISQNRTKLALSWASGFSIWGKKELYDFNPASGLVSNKMILDSVGGGYGVCFSPDNSKLYFSDFNGPFSGRIIQFDITSNNAATIAATQTVITPTSGTTHLKRGPDGKIYYNANYANVTGSIESPNLAGLACSPNSNAVTLINSGSSLGLPNVVPIIKRDTFHLPAQSIKAPCFATGLSLQPANDTSSWDYLWSDGSTGPVTVTNAPGTYWVSYHEPPCAFHTDTFIVAFSNGMLPSIAIFQSCWNSNNGKAYAYTYAGDTVNYQYVWKNLSGDTLSLNDTLPGVVSGYYAVHISTHKCDTIIQLYIPEDNRRVSFALDSFICLGDAVLFQNTTGTGFPLYHWDFGDGAISIQENPLHIYTQPGSYRVRLIGTGNVCTDTAFKTVTVDPVYTGAFLTDRDSICTGESIVFSPTVDSSTRNLDWILGDGTSFTNNSESIRHAYDHPGVMAIRLTSHFRACPDTSFTDTVYVYPMPLVYLGPDSGICINGTPVFLQNLQPPPDGSYSNTWNTGDTTSRIKVVNPGNFSLTVKAAPLGCSTTETVTVNKDCHINIPNVFTPNDDGYNDYFFPRQLLSEGVIKFNMQVFNRWGQVIFETTKPDGRGWDGRFNGQVQPVGVYLYRINVTLKNGLFEKYEGNVTLLR